MIRGNCVVISEDHEFGYNTLYNSPAAGHQLPRAQEQHQDPRDVRARIHHNLIHDVMLRSFDSAALTRWARTTVRRIDHNVIYNLQGERKYGIYFDFASHGIVDHNVVYNVTRPSTSTGTRTGAQNIWL
jgi:hypothetical protein